MAANARQVEEDSDSGSVSDREMLKHELEQLSVKKLKELCSVNSLSYYRLSKCALVAKLVGHLSTEHAAGDNDEDDEALFEEADIDADIAAISKGHICPRTRVKYQNSQQHLFKYIEENHLSVGLLREPGSDRIIGIADLEHFDVEVFKKFIRTHCRKQRKDGSFVMNPETQQPMLNAFESVCDHRKGLFNLFVETKTPMPSQFASDIKHFFTGLKRRDAQEKAKGFRKNSEGKSPIPFSVYVKLMETFYVEGKFFEAAYASLTWNLICRTDNTACITLKHMGSDADAITVLFNVSKTNQEGDEFEQKRRLYGIGRDYRLCVAFALGCYLMSCPELGTGDCIQLFPGSPGSQKKRFSESLADTLKSEEMREFLAAHGLKPSDIGAHSFRKGGATYVTSGSTGGPSIVAVCSRAGWALGNVLDRYLKFDVSGDAFVGRILAGYPLNLAAFADLPPHAVNMSFEDLRAFFPLLQEHVEMGGVCSFAYASLKHYSRQVRELPASVGRSAMLKFAVYQEAWQNASVNVLCGPETDTSAFKATGIPPNVHILQRCLQMYHAIESLPERMMADFAKMLSEQGFHATHVTPAALDCALEKHRVKLTQDMNAMFDKKLAAMNVSGNAQQGSHPDGWKLYWWRKGAEKNACPRIVPELYKLPLNISPQTAWQQWWGPHLSDVNPEITLPPIKACTCFHLPRAQQPRWSEWNAFFEECMAIVPVDLKNQLTDAYKLRNVPLHLLNDAYTAAIPVVSRYRGGARMAQLRFSTVLRHWAKARAATRAAQQ